MGAEPIASDLGAAASDPDFGLSEPPVLRALVKISQAVIRANYFDEALEVIAEEALEALNAASVSISRWEPDEQILRTLINVGDLAPIEERWPEQEVYYVADDGPVMQLLQHGLPYAMAVGDENVAPAEEAWLGQLGKESELGVPIMYEDVMWGELWVTGVGGRRFGPDDVQLLQAIAAYAAMAIGRSELLSTVWRYAHQDPLTGLANRRELERFFAETDWQSAKATLLVCDLDGFKAVNDREGHPAGDALLRNVGAALGEVAATVPGALAVRLGGDEFCVLLPDSTLDDGERFACQASSHVRRSVGTYITLSWGACAHGPHLTSGQELLAAADAALLEAKRMGPGHYSVGVCDPLAAARDDRRTFTAAGERSALDLLVPRVVELLDEHSPADPVAALHILGAELHNAVNAAAWALSQITEDGTGVQTIRGLDSVRDPESGLALLRKIDSGTVYPLADYPATAAVLASGGALITGVDLDDGDPAERALLADLGYRAVLLVAAKGDDRDYLLEVYSADGHHLLAAVAPHARVLARYCTAKYS